MKLIIDIPNETYQDVFKNGFIYDKDNGIISYAIQLGTPIPDNATNGDVIKAMFPNTELHKESDYVSLTIQNGVYLEDRDGSWWNAPYQKGGTNG